MPVRRRRTLSATATATATATAPRTPHLRLVGGSDDTLVRLAKVRAAQKRIANGYYDRDAVRDRLAQALLTELTRS